MKGHEIDPYDALAKGFEQNRVFTHMRPTELYGKWLEATWALLDATGNPDAFRACLDHYSYEEGREFARLVVVYTEAVGSPPTGGTVTWRRKSARTTASCSSFTASTRPCAKRGSGATRCIVPR